LALIVNHEFRSVTASLGQVSNSKIEKIAKIVVGWLLVQLLVLMLWIPFRAPDFTVTLEVIKQLFALTPATTGQAPVIRGGFNWQTGGLATALVAMLLLHYFREKGVFFQAWRQLPRWLYSLCLGGVFALAIAFRAVDSQPCIYFQF
jgi:hypothetical protein